MEQQARYQWSSLSENGLTVGAIIDIVQQLEDGLSVGILN